uniref:Rho guanine nucleotide exchange factor (GEF) 38 n=1 Tax=Neogobius melanostomus TaxID=47308 RepID=A0A8C6T724_9GOBI
CVEGMCDLSSSFCLHLTEKLNPSDLSTPTSPALDLEELRLRKMKRRSKVIQELVQTEKDYLTELELCIREMVVDVDRLFTNMETVCEVSAALLHRLQEAMTDPDPEGALEDVYKIYCYHHDDANTALKAYDKEEEVKRHLTACVLALKGKPNLLDVGSLLIKPVQRIMKYPLLLGELWQTTPENHPDHQPVQQAFTAAKIINININEFRRRKDIVMKYKRLEDEGTLRGKLNKFNIHSIRKKGDRFAGYLKILTGVEPQVPIHDELIYQIYTCTKNMKGINYLSLSLNLHTKYIGITTYSVSVFILKKDRVEQLVLAPLSSLQGMFTAPQKLIQKRYDKLLDYCSHRERSSSQAASSASPSPSSPSVVPDDQGPARRDYEALNAMLVEELQRFNLAAHTILTNCVVSLVALLKQLMEKLLLPAPSLHQLPVSTSRIMRHTFKLMERKVTACLATVRVPRERIYQLKRKCNGCQEQDLSLLEGELVALLEDSDPFGSSSRWLVHSGVAQGYVYSTFLKQYNPLRDSQRGGQPVREQQLTQQQQTAMADEDFDNISLFVSGSNRSSLCSFNLNTTDSGSILSGLQGETLPFLYNTMIQCKNLLVPQFYAVYAFQARGDQELSLQEYQHVRILQFCDLGGNKDWWLAEANGQKGYDMFINGVGKKEQTSNS